MQIFAHTPEYHVRCLRAKISTAEECSELKEKEGWLVQRGAMALAKAARRRAGLSDTARFWEEDRSCGIPRISERKAFPR